MALPPGLQNFVASYGYRQSKLYRILFSGCQITGMALGCQRRSPCCLVGDGRNCSTTEPGAVATGWPPHKTRLLPRKRQEEGSQTCNVWEGDCKCARALEARGDTISWTRCSARASSARDLSSTDPDVSRLATFVNAAPAAIDCLSQTSKGITVRTRCCCTTPRD